MTIKIETTADAVWTATGAWTEAPQYVVFFIGSNFVCEEAITEPAVLANRDTYTIASGVDIPFNITPRGGSAGDADDALLALLADTPNVTLALFSDDPGSSYNQNELSSTSEPGYARVTVAGRIVSA